MESGLSTKTETNQGRNGGRLRKGGGRPKGAKNKLPGDIREAVVKAFEAGGGYKWLIEQMRENPKAFMQLLGKAMPMQITGAGDQPLIEGGLIVNVVGVPAKDGRPVPYLESEPIEVGYVPLDKPDDKQT